MPRSNSATVRRRKLQIRIRKLESERDALIVAAREVVEGQTRPHAGRSNGQNCQFIARKLPNSCQIIANRSRLANET